jgi:hypothetical protein
LYKLKIIQNSRASLLYASFPLAKSSKYLVGVFVVGVGGVMMSAKSWVVARVLPLAVQVEAEDVCVLCRGAAGS